MFACHFAILMSLSETVTSSKWDAWLIHHPCIMQLQDENYLLRQEVRTLRADLTHDRVISAAVNKDVAKVLAEYQANFENLHLSHAQLQLKLYDTAQVVKEIEDIVTSLREDLLPLYKQQYNGNGAKIGSNKIVSRPVVKRAVLVEDAHTTQYHSRYCRFLVPDVEVFNDSSASSGCKELPLMVPKESQKPRDHWYGNF